MDTASYDGNYNLQDCTAFKEGGRFKRAGRFAPPSQDTRYIRSVVDGVVTLTEPAALPEPALKAATVEPKSAPPVKASRIVRGKDLGPEDLLPPLLYRPPILTSTHVRTVHKPCVHQGSVSGCWTTPCGPFGGAKYVGPRLRRKTLWALADL